MITRYPLLRCQPSHAKLFARHHSLDDMTFNSDKVPSGVAFEGPNNDSALPTLNRPCMPRAASHKRDLDDVSVFSSDPPLFSSHELPSFSADSYVQHRNERRHKGVWYKEESLKRLRYRGNIRGPRERGPFRRKFDSGVWLGALMTVQRDGATFEKVA